MSRAHVLEDGGGRELAYVKMSRANQRTTLYPVADDLEQAVEDMGRSWSASRRIGWAIDHGVASKDSPAVQAAKARTAGSRPTCATPVWWPSGRPWPR